MIIFLSLLSLVSEADQRIAAQDMIECMKRRAPECKRGKEDDNFANWMKRFADNSPSCKKLAREVAEEIVRENPGKSFKRYLEDVGVM